MCLRVGLFGFNLFRHLCASCIWVSVFFRFGKFSTTISSNIFSTPFFSSPFGIMSMHILACFILSHRSFIFLPFFFSFGFLSTVLIGPSSLFSLTSHLFVPLHYLFCCSVPLTQLLSLQMNFTIYLGASSWFLVPF